MELETRPLKDWTVVRPRTERLDVRLVPEFKRCLEELVEGGHLRIILDLGEVQYLDSAGLGAIVFVLRALNGRGRLALAGVSQQVSGLLDVTGLDQILTVVDRPEAILERV